MNKKILSKKDFETAKLLLGKGVTGAECARILGLSTSTVTRIKQADDWGCYCEYLQKKSEYNKKWYEAKKAAASANTTKPEPVVKMTESVSGNVHKMDVFASSYQISRLIDEMKQQNEYLKLISNKLAFIVESLS